MLCGESYNVVPFQEPTPVIRLLSQLLIERYVSVKEKESNLLVTYFKDLVNRIKVLRPNEQIEERKKKDI